jgi:hypothetical protein
MIEQHHVQKTEIAIILETAIEQRAAVSYSHVSMLSEILLLSVAKHRGQDFFILGVTSGLAGPRTDP